MSTVLYRPFEDEDFEPLVEIVRTLWHNDDDVPDAAFGTLEATCDLAHCLSVSTFSQVALIDGAPRGIILARSENDCNQDLSRWATIEAKSACAMDSYDAKAAHTFQTWYDGMRKVDGHASGDRRVDLIGSLAPLLHGVVQKDILKHVVRNLGEVGVALLAQLHDGNLDVAAKGIHKLVKELLAALFAKGEL